MTPPKEVLRVSMRTTHQQQSQCPHCGAHVDPHDATCGRCGGVIAVSAQTTQLTRRPLAFPLDPSGSCVFAPEASAILQVLPSGTCITLTLKQPIILGRGESKARQNLLDLSEFGALDHGVSRLHCRLERHGDRLTVTDLGSANGTYVNGEPLHPHHIHLLRHGDKLILGTLHLLVSFSLTPDS